MLAELANRWNRRPSELLEDMPAFVLDVRCEAAFRKWQVEMEELDRACNERNLAKRIQILPPTI